MNKGKIQGQLWKQYLKKERLRNVCAVLSIILTTILYTSVFIIVQQLYRNNQENNMQITGWKAHAMIRGVTEQQFNDVKSNELVKECAYFYSFGLVEDDELHNRTQVQYNEEKAAEWNYYTIEEGRYPKEEDEIVVSDEYLDSKGIDGEIGQKITIEFNLNQKLIKKNAVISGIYKSKYSGQDVLLISKIYSDELLQQIAKESELYDSFLGKKVVEVNFYTKNNIEEKLIELCTDAKISQETTAAYNVAYTQSAISLKMILFAVFACLIVCVIGSLIIYNIYYISVIKDIQFYGLLRVIGFGKKQIKSYMYRQIFVHGLIGIPIGLLGGCLISKGIIRRVSELLSFAVTPFHNVFLSCFGAVVLIILTILISNKKPVKIAYSVSPIDAKKYQDINCNVKKQYKSNRGGKIHVMAYKNLWRDSKRTKFAISSITLSLMLFQIIFSFVSGLNVDEFVDKQVIFDYTISTNSYFSANYNREVPTLDDDVISDIQNIVKNEESGGLCNKADVPCEVKDEKILSRMAEYGMDPQSSEILLNTYAVDEFFYPYFCISKGSFEEDKFETGNYVILTGLFRSEECPVLYDVGDEITITSESEQKSYTVMAVGELPSHIGTFRTIDGIQIYLPTKEWSKLFGEENYYTYVFNCKDSSKQEKIDMQLEQYCKQRTNLSYRSRKTLSDEFHDFIGGTLLMGVSLAIVIVLISIINYINIMCTSVFRRKREFAMMECIGINKRSIKQVLLLEGLYLVVISLLICLTFGNLITFILMKVIEDIVWFYSLTINFTIFLCVAIALIVVALFVPVISLHLMNREETILERIR